MRNVVTNRVLSRTVLVPFAAIGHRLFQLTLALLLLNPAAIFNIENMNQVNKFTLLLSALCFMAERKVYYWRVVILIAVVFLTFMAAVSTSNPDFSFERYIRAVVSFIAPWLFLSFLPMREDALKIIRAVAFTPLAAAVWGYVLQTAGIWSVWSGVDGGFLRFQGAVIPASMTAIAMIGSFAAMFLFVYRKKFSLLLLVVNFGLLILSGGRMGIAVAVLVISITAVSRLKINFSTVFAGVMTMVASGGFLFLVAPSTLERFLDNSLSGRELIWSFLERIQQEHLYAGIGLGHQPTVVPKWLEDFTGTTAAHNEYLRLNLELGIIAYYPVIALLLVLVIVAWRKIALRGDYLMLASAAALFLYATTDNSFSSINQVLLVIVPYFEAASRYWVAAASKRRVSAKMQAYIVEPSRPS